MKTNPDTSSEKSLVLAIAYMNSLNRSIKVNGIHCGITKAYKRKFYESIPQGYHADFGIFSQKYCITHPKLGTVAM